MAITTMLLLCAVALNAQSKTETIKWLEKKMEECLREYSPFSSSGLEYTYVEGDEDHIIKRKYTIPYAHIRRIYIPEQSLVTSIVIEVEKPLKYMEEETIYDGLNESIKQRRRETAIIYCTYYCGTEEIQEFVSELRHLAQLNGAQLTN